MVRNLSSGIRRDRGLSALIRLSKKTQKCWVDRIGGSGGGIGGGACGAGGGGGGGCSGTRQRVFQMNFLTTLYM